MARPGVIDRLLTTRQVADYVGSDPRRFASVPGRRARGDPLGLRRGAGGSERGAALAGCRAPRLNRLNESCDRADSARLPIWADSARLPIWARVRSDSLRLPLRESSDVARRSRLGV